MGRTASTHTTQQICAGVAEKGGMRRENLSVHCSEKKLIEHFFAVGNLEIESFTTVVLRRDSKHFHASASLCVVKRRQVPYAR